MKPSEKPLSETNPCLRDPKLRKKMILEPHGQREDIIALYLYRFGEDGLPIRKTQLAELIGVNRDSLEMRLSNFQALDIGKGLTHVAKQEQQVYERFRNTSKEGLLTQALNALQQIEAMRL